MMSASPVTCPDLPCPLSLCAVLQTLVVLFLFFVTGYNCMAVYVTKYLSAIWHAILDNFRPITIWGMDLLIFYVLLPNTGQVHSPLPDLT